MNAKNELSMILYLGIASISGTLFIKVVESLNNSSLIKWVCRVGGFVIFVYFFITLFCSPEIYLKSQCERKPCVADSRFVYVEEVKRCLDINGFERNLEFIEKYGGN